MNQYIALAVPFFFVLIGIELVVARARGERVYRLADAVTDVSCGVTSQVMLLFYGALQLAIYAWLYDHARLFTLSTASAWLVALLGVDFLYYWWHRASHEVNLLWAAHVVHHQSEDYNLAVALRQAVLTSWTALVFYLPLAVLGVPAPIYAASVALSTLYQFWIHTQLIGKIRGPLDYVLNLPAHHRVHHAVNPQYLDKNYGAVLIVWDRLFGTYEEEREPPVYGITQPLASFNPWWAQVHYFRDLARLSARTPRRLDKLQVWFRSPAWLPKGLAQSPKTASRPKYDVPLTRGLAAYVLVQEALIIGGATILLFYQEQLARSLVGAAALSVLVGLLALGALLEHKRWAWPLEAARLVATAMLLVGLATAGA